MMQLLPPVVKDLLLAGTVIPAHPLALTDALQIDEHCQRGLTRYYIESGAGGIAIGVHTTQFAIRKPEFNFFEPVLKMAADEIAGLELKRPFIKVAGICGPTGQAVKEAELAVRYGYHLGLVSLGGLPEYSEAELIGHISVISQSIPVFGFYLQPAVGGRALSYDFWRVFADIPNVHAIKVAAFNRYQTLDVVRAICESERSDEIALYTGNDDNIVADLLTPYRFAVDGSLVEKRFAGGLLGHWAVWTRRAVSLLQEIKQCIANDYAGIEGLLRHGMAVTDMNAALFDVQHSFSGCIAGIHEVLRRQGLMKGIWCLDPHEGLSPGQMEELDRIYRSYPSFIE